MKLTLDNLGESTDKQKDAWKAVEDFQKRTRGHNLTKKEGEEGARLEERWAEASKRFYEDKEADDRAKGALNRFIQSQSEYHRGDIISSHTRAIGGGGGLYDARANRMEAINQRIEAASVGMGPPVPPGFNFSAVGGGGNGGMGSMNHDVLRDFTDAMRGHTDALNKDTGGSIEKTVTF